MKWTWKVPSKLLCPSPLGSALGSSIYHPALSLRDDWCSPSHNPLLFTGSTRMHSRLKASRLSCKRAWHWHCPKCTEETSHTDWNMFLLRFCEMCHGLYSKVYSYWSEGSCSAWVGSLLHCGFFFYCAAKLNSAWLFPFFFSFFFFTQRNQWLTPPPPLLRAWWTDDLTRSTRLLWTCSFFASWFVRFY